MRFDPPKQFCIGASPCRQPFLFRGQSEPCKEGDFVKPYWDEREYRPCPLVYATDIYVHAAAYGLKGIKATLNISLSRYEDEPVAIAAVTLPSNSLHTPKSFYASLINTNAYIQTVSSLEFVGKFYTEPRSKQEPLDWVSKTSVKIEKVEVLKVPDLLKRGVQLFFMTESVLEKHRNRPIEDALEALLSVDRFSWINLSPEFDAEPLARSAALAGALRVELPPATHRISRSDRLNALVLGIPLPDRAL